jgi:regulator of sigma E protease
MMLGALVEIPWGGAYGLLAALALIAVLITIHEFGHFIAARAVGVRVKVFSIGIGPRVAGIRIGDTDYRISGLPFGGYVRMAGADPFNDSGLDDDDDPTAEGAFMSKPVWKRLVIVAAGPVMNLILPFFVFTALKVAGDPQYRADVGTVRPDTPAADAGVQADDRIVELEGTSVLTWTDVDDALAEASPPIELVVERDGTRLSLQIPGAITALQDLGISASAPDTEIGVDDPSSPAASAGLASGDLLLAVEGTEVRSWNAVVRLAARADSELTVRVRSGETERTVVLRQNPAWSATTTPAEPATYTRWGLTSAEVFVGDFPDETSVAAQAGVLPGDRMLTVDGGPVRRFEDVITAVAGSTTGEREEMVARALTLQLRRAGQTVDLVMTPRVVEGPNRMGRLASRPLLGIASAGGIVHPPLVRRPYPLPEAASRATSETTAIARFMVEQLGLMLTGEARVSDNLGGPVAMVRQTKEAAEQGAYEIARLLGIFSLSLGIINLFPMPVLDGGQIVMYLAEWVRGRPLPMVLRERAQQIGVIFLVLLMLFVFANDIKNWIQGA